MSSYARYAHSFRSYLPPRQTLLSRIRLGTILTLQFACLSHLIASNILEIRLCQGASMLPTLGMQGDILLVGRWGAMKFWDKWMPGRNALQLDENPSSIRGYQPRMGSSKFDRTAGLPIQLGDIVVAASPTDPMKQVCKRILGLPGDQVVFDPRLLEEQDQDRVTETLRDQEKTAKRQGEESPMIEELRRAGLVVERLRASEEEGSLPPPLFDRPAAGPSTPSAILLPGNADRPPLLSLSALQPQQPKTITVPTGHVWLSGDNLANSTDSRNYGPVPLGCLRGKILMRVSSSFSC